MLVGGTLPVPCRRRPADRAEAFPDLDASGWLLVPRSPGHRRWHGGMFIAEADSAAAAFEAAATFADLVDFQIVPVLDIMEAVPINAQVFAWIDSVS